MRIRVVPFDPPRHVQPAAELLAARHRRDRAREPLFPATYEDAAACRPQVEEPLARAGWHGVFAEDERSGEPLGFAVMTPFLFAPTHMLASFFPPRSVGMGYGSHAAREGAEYDAYREMYAALGEHFVERGFFEHLVWAPASDVAAVEAWASVGFARDMTAAIRDVAPVAGANAANVEVHQAGPEDIDVINALNHDLTLHHVRAPIFFPYIRDADDSGHDFQRSLLADPANAHWVAYDNGRAAGMNTFMPPTWVNEMQRPERAVYLYQGIVAPDARRGGVGAAILDRGVAWAREQGYEHVALHFAAANIPGARFWQENGFRSVEHRLRRRVDERIAWANR
jgi:GNAT superfamily N-acetyltransferase